MRAACGNMVYRGLIIKPPFRSYGACGRRAASVGVILRHPQPRGCTRAGSDVPAASLVEVAYVLASFSRLLKKSTRRRGWHVIPWICSHGVICDARIG